MSGLSQLLTILTFVESASLVVAFRLFYGIDKRTKTQLNQLTAENDRLNAQMGRERIDHEAECARLRARIEVVEQSTDEYRNRWIKSTEDHSATRNTLLAIRGELMAVQAKVGRTNEIIESAAEDPPEATP